MKPMNQNLHGGKSSPLFEKITLGVAIFSALVALAIALIARF